MRYERDAELAACLLMFATSVSIPSTRPSCRSPSRLERGGPKLVTKLLDPVLIPLGFAPGQVGLSGKRGQVIFCRGEIDSADGGCVDLVVEVEATPAWRITDLRYWGFPADRWHLHFGRSARLPQQLAGLVQTLPSELG